MKKLAILADAAKYDASCSSSGTDKKNSLGGKGVGSTGGTGICHSYTPDGRCISLLKILMTNVCMYDCLYCINRQSSSVQRARFRPEEVVALTINFYKRNYIEGLFLSSGIVKSGDYTMEQLIRVAKSLREEHHFKGYIHLKTIPDASPELVAEAGRWADRLSINVELPTTESLSRLAPEKNAVGIAKSMSRIHEKEKEYKAARKENTRTKPPTFAPGGQSTQMIVGADDAKDLTVLQRAKSLYDDYKLRRVYYSGYSPIPDPAKQLPMQAPPLLREHRLYQADWLLRFYHFKVDEIVSANQPDLDLNVDPKMSWALRHPTFFPVDLNKACQQTLLRVPGLGVRGVQKIIKIRRWHALRLADLSKLRIAVKKILPFVELADYQPKGALQRLVDQSSLFLGGAPAGEQLELFGELGSPRVRKK